MKRSYFAKLAAKNLTRNEYKILMLFLAYPNAVISRNDIQLVTGIRPARATRALITLCTEALIEPCERVRKGERQYFRLSKPQRK